MRSILVLLALAAAACGSPAAPTSTAPSDRIELATGGYDLTAYQTAPAAACGRPEPQMASITVPVTVAHEGSAWFARSASAASGDLEIRFYDAGGPLFTVTSGGRTSTLLRVLATMRGKAIQTSNGAGERVTFEVAPSHATIPTEASVMTNPIVPIPLLGMTSLAGTMTFTAGEVSTSCQVATTWLLSQN